jgi:hypothetical protein
MSSAFIRFRASQKHDAEPNAKPVRRRMSLHIDGVDEGRVAAVVAVTRMLAECVVTAVRRPVGLLW